MSESATSLLASEQLPDQLPESVGMLKIALGIYVAILIAVSVAASRKVKTEADYLIAGRSTRPHHKRRSHRTGSSPR